jgi:hypothetical protein
MELTHRLLDGPLRDFQVVGADPLEEVAAAAGRQLYRWNPDFEYEIKFRVDAPGAGAVPADPADLLSGILTLLADAPTVSVLDFRAGSLMHPDYWVDGIVEYSVFTYEGRVLQKIKRHEPLEHGLLTIMKSREDFVYDEHVMQRNVSGLPHVGRLTKARDKTFVVHPETGTAYSLAVTRCSAAGKDQLQAEVEYAGHLVDEPGPAIDEADVLGALALVGQVMLQACAGTLVPDRQTKLDFLRGALGASSPRAAQ